MTTEGKRPSNWVTAITNYGDGFGSVELNLAGLRDYLDAEHDRRLAWEKSVEERLGRIEGVQAEGHVVSPKTAL